MAETKVAIVYYSMTGTVDTMARRLAATAEGLGAEVRLRAVGREDAAGAPGSDERPQEPTADDVVWADVVLLGTPTRFGNVSGRLKTFLDTLGGPWSQGQLADKVYAGFTSSQTLHGGQEATLLNLYTTIHHFGGIVVSPGYTDGSKFVDGNPYGVGHVTGGGNDAPVEDVTNTALDHLVTRAVTVSRRLTSCAPLTSRSADSGTSQEPAGHSDPMTTTAPPTPRASDRTETSLLGVVATTAVALVAGLLYGSGLFTSDMSFQDGGGWAGLGVLLAVAMLQLVPIGGMGAVVMLVRRRLTLGTPVLAVGVVVLLVLVLTMLAGFVTSESSTAALLFVFLPFYLAAVVLLTLGLAAGLHALRRRRLGAAS
ncbi:NAD(P)H-dependent oxidoreductase [Pseudokineococcus sp. 1T1Z-3]|uniref:flavodoxin family protein n=1 Tax=Pseudokineococcus sp. 1T1Z-3 TaxID=3132745 RepID=UPI0030A0032B